MIGLETVYLVRVTNYAPYDISDKDQISEAIERQIESSNKTVDEIADMVYNKYCNRDNCDGVSVEKMKIEPLVYEDYIGGIEDE